MINDILLEAKEQMNKTIESLQKQLLTIRTGRAHASMLDSVRIDYYGSMSPLSQIASVSTPDSNMIVVKPWEKNLLGDIEKAIFDANLGMTPSNDGEMIRVPVPPMSEDRRRDYVKMAKTKCEDAKISIRNARRDANEMLKAAQKDSDISLDDEKLGQKNIQDETNAFTTQIDQILKKKEAEILAV